MKRNKRGKLLILGIIVLILIGILWIKIINKEETKKDIIQSQQLLSNNEGNTQNNGNNEIGTNNEVETGKVIIKYLDEQGQSIKPDETIEGPVGSQYTTSRASIDHYISNGFEPVNKIGDFKSADEDITVIYYYKPVSETVKVEQNNDEITVKVVNVLQDREYKLLLEQESTEGEKLTGGEFTLVDAKYENELMNGVTRNGGLTLGAVNVSNDIDEQYEISEDKAPEGYEKAIKTENKRFAMRLAKSFNTTTNAYELKVTSGDTEFELEEKDDADEIIVKVRNEKIKTYDLAMKKIITSIDGETTPRTVSARVDSEGQIVYDETNKAEQEITVRDYQKLIYTMRVYNQGNQDLPGQIITDILPAGLKFLPESQINIDNGWSFADGKITTSKLVGETIGGIDTSSQTEVKYKELQVELEVDEDAATSGNILTNTASVPSDEREEDTDNNTDTETVKLVRTTPIYDLAIFKYLTKINNQDTGRSVTASINNSKQIEYTENNNAKTIQDGQKIEYTIRVYNEGNKDIKGTKITDIVPKGLKFDETSTLNTQYGWTKNGNIVETTYLVNRPEIKGVKAYKDDNISYEELKIEFTFDANEAEEGTEEIVNEVILETAENETDDLDNTDDDQVDLSVERKYNYVMKKFASSINGTETGRYVTASLDADQSIKYNTNKPSQEVRDEQKVVYTLRVFNEGNLDVEGKKLTESIPTGLRFVENSEINTQYGWSQVDGKLETNYLIGKTIAGFKNYRNETPKYLDVKVELVVVEDDTDESVTKLINTASIEKGDGETDEDDNEDTDEVTLKRREKTYNFVMKKYASEINGEATGRSVEARLNDNNVIEIVETKPRKVVTEGQKVIYTLRVYNTGNQNMTGTKVTENIPTGLKFVEYTDGDNSINDQFKWTKNENNLETNYLTDKTINGTRADKGELPNYIDVKVEFEVTRDGIGKTGKEITNLATVEKHENEPNDDDNTSTDTVTLEKIPTYELTVHKFASKVNGNATGRGIDVSVNNNGEVVYTKRTTETKVRDGEVVTYVFRIFNTGDTPITGTKVKEDVPNGLKFLPDSQINKRYGWKFEGNDIVSEYVVGKTIQPYDTAKSDSVNYLDVEVEFEVVEETANLDNLITNKVIIERNHNEPDPTKPDPTNPNPDPDPNKPDPHESTETVTLIPTEKTYDLVMKKFVYSLDNKLLDKEITAKLGSNGKIEFENDDTQTTVNKKQKAVFTLRVFNVGNQAMTLKRVTDTLPAGVEYVTDSTINQKYGWTVENSVATTDYLVGKTLIGMAKGETVPKYIDVQIECYIAGTDAKNKQIFTNTAKIEPNDNDQNKGNNEDTTDLIIEPEKSKVSDLSMQKFLYSVDGATLGDREVKAKNINGKISYTRKDDIYKVANNQKVVFTLRVFNVGDGETLGREVVENIPAGFDIVEDSEINKANGWKLCKEDKAGNLIEVDKADKATVMKTDKLKTETIAGFNVANNETPRYKDVQVELIVNESEIKTTDRIITNIAKVVPKNEEPDQDNDKSEEKVQVKIFDLNVSKYIKEITIKDNDGEQTTKLGIEKKGKIFKKEIDKKKINQTEVIVTYGLKVKNLGEIPGYATEILDYIPEDLKIENTENWKIDGQNATYTGIAKELIEPGDSTTVEFTCRWQLNENNLGERNNKVIIQAYANDYNAKDPTPDKDNEEKFIISIRTGATETTIFIVLAVLVITAITLKTKINKQKARTKKARGKK